MHNDGTLNWSPVPSSIETHSCECVLGLNLPVNLSIFEVQRS